MPLDAVVYVNNIIWIMKGTSPGNRGFHTQRSSSLRPHVHIFDHWTIIGTSLGKRVFTLNVFQV